jgi:predicted TIM-barrel fold metal-dependent hydrolase
MPDVLEAFLNAQPVPGPVVDIHLHLPPRELFYRLSGQSRWRIPAYGMWEQNENFQNLVSLVRHMDRVGVTKALAFVNGFERLEEGFECVRRFPGRFLPMVSFWPGMGREDEDRTTSPGGRRVPESPRELRDVLERIHHHGWRGIKMWEPRAPEPLTWLYEGVLGFAHEKRLLVVHHSWGPPETLDRLAQRYPGMYFLMAHSLGSPKAIESYAQVIRKHPHVFASTTNSRMPGMIEAMVRSFSAEKLVMGSDFILHTVEFSVGNIAYARIPDAAKRAILGLNMKALLSELGYWDTWGAQTGSDRVPG